MMLFFEYGNSLMCNAVFGVTLTSSEYTCFCFSNAFYAQKLCGLATVTGWV